MKGLKFLVVETTSPTASLLAAMTGSWPPNGAVVTGSLRNSSRQATVRAASHLIAVTTTPVLALYAGPGAGVGLAPPAGAPPAGAPPPAAPAPAGVAGGCPWPTIGRERFA